MWLAETICILQLLDKHKQKKNKPKREKGGSNGFCPCYFLSIPPIHAGIAFPTILACADQEGKGGGSLNFFIFTYIKITVKGLGSL